MTEDLPVILLAREMFEVELYLLLDEKSLIVELGVYERLSLLRGFMEKLLLLIEAYGR